jgi:putative ABC transport system ATP-binding protein
MSRNDRARLRRRSIGYVFQDFNLLAGLTAGENVSLPLELDGTPAKAARVAGMAALEDLGLADRASRYPDELSGGERQRVAIARAVVGDRRLLLADEPTGALDTASGEDVRRLLNDLHADGQTIVLVTHDRALAESCATRTVQLVDGRVIGAEPNPHESRRPPSSLTRKSAITSSGSAFGPRAVNSRWNSW